MHYRTQAKILSKKIYIITELTVSSLWQIDQYGTILLCQLDAFWAKNERARRNRMSCLVSSYIPNLNTIAPAQSARVTCYRDQVNRLAFVTFVVGGMELC